MVQTHGVIGNTADFGSVILGSSPSGSTDEKPRRVMRSGLLCSRPNGTRSLSLRTTARNMGKNDLWIAATTYVTGSKLITSDKDFDHLDGEYFEVLHFERQK